ncbi:phosphatase PAP2 family protein [Ramlibacter sp. MMS24-I3-19]|uniref:phosphatase PAP2 family protein n=1 Tax=Ramlibacter sp. MMS24-I3-19 TaxID=3416606 RepID=UPI003D06BB0B
MNWLDSWTMTHINVFARRSWAFDQMVAFISVNHLFKGGLLMLFIWWAWFRTEGKATKEREHMIATLLSSAVALLVGRLLVILLPFRVRPLHEASLDFVKPYGVSEEALAKLSSFPSDHAVLFFALATGLYFVSRRLGVFVFAYTMVMIVLPRLYLGLHYPTDILAGAVVGAGISWLGNIYLMQTRVVRSIEELSWSRAMYFYPALFLVTYQIADMFETSRALVRSVLQFGKVMVALGLGATVGD